MRASQYKLLTSGVQASHSSPVSPSHLLPLQGSLSPWCRTPGLGASLWLSLLTPQGKRLPVSSRFSSRSPPRGTDPALIAFFPSYQITCLSFLQLWMYSKLLKTLKEMEIPDHLTCLLRNLYAGQKATVRTGHGTPDWFQIGKGVHLTSMQSTS